MPSLIQAYGRQICHGIAKRHALHIGTFLVIPRHLQSLFDILIFTFSARHANRVCRSFGSFCSDRQTQAEILAMFLRVLRTITIMTGCACSPVDAQSLELKVMGTLTGDDDYLCWAPAEAEIRLIEPQAEAVRLVISSRQVPSAHPAGSVWFSPSTGVRPTPDTFQPVDTLTLEVPGDGSAVYFFVAGKTASTDGKDVEIVASTPDGQELHRLAVMVRIRKNAEHMTDLEVRRFLEALATLHDVDNQSVASKYNKYVEAHGTPFAVLHGSPIFPTWHRAYLLSLERELQAIDQRVALPFWKFDEEAPRLFSPSFLGTVSGATEVPGAFVVQFDTANPLFGWSMRSAAQPSLLLRLSDAGESDQVPWTDFQSVTRRSTYGAMWTHLERNYHNSAHASTGGWLVTATSPRDPLFFLLHANVDRAWAQWQQQHNRFDDSGTDDSSYAPLGTYPGPSGGRRFQSGTYAKDPLWPWSNAGGDQGTPDRQDDWPILTEPIVMPALGPRTGPPAVFDNLNLIDFQDERGDGMPLGYSYEGVPFVR